MVKLNIIIMWGPFTSKTPIKKFPDNTTVSTLKNIFQNMYKIPAEK